jgi:hypothetical protein
MAKETCYGSQQSIDAHSLFQVSQGEQHRYVQGQSQMFPYRRAIARGVKMLEVDAARIRGRPVEFKPATFEQAA